MDHTPMVGRRRTGGGRHRGALAAAAVLALGGLTLLGYTFLTQEPAPPGPPRAASKTAPTTPADKRPQPPARSPRPAGTYQRPVGPIMTTSAPVRITIPALDVTSPIIRLGLNQDGTMQVPSGPGKAGWYLHSPTPGALGPAVIAGHVTWDRRPDVFFKLGESEPGDKIEVTRRDGSTAIFEITKVAQYSKKDFPTQAVYGTSDHAALRLITCGGVFDGENNRYLDNVVAYARLLPSASAHH